MLRICDINNFFSFTGGGVRTYHLNKLDFFADRDDVEYVLIAPSDKETVELHGRARLVHVPAVPAPGAPNYRYILDPGVVQRQIQRYQPQLVEVGSPYIAPWITRVACRGSGALVCGFWHADYPRAYIERPLAEIHPDLGRLGLEAAWWYARQTYGHYDATFAAADCVVQALWERGIPRVFQTPLGVDTDRFDTRHRSEELRRHAGAKDTTPLVFFPHRLLEEKGLTNVIKAWPDIARATGARLVFAGVGPGKPKLDAFMDGRDDVTYLGYVDDPNEMAAWYASCDAAFALSAFETFGLSAAEAMASGCAIIGADAGAIAEFVGRADAGVLVPYNDSDSLRAASIALLQSDFAAVGQRARDFAARHFSWHAAFTRLEQAYREVIAAGGRVGLPPEPRRWSP